jgi:hypothetical protein
MSNPNEAVRSPSVSAICGFRAAAAHRCEEDLLLLIVACRLTSNDTEKLLESSYGAG